MSEENVEIVRRAIDGWNRDDWDAVASCYDPQVVMSFAPDAPEAEDAHGWEQTLKSYQRMKDSWDLERAEVDELREVGDRILVRFRYIVRGRESGVPIETPVFWVAGFRAGRIIRSQFFRDETRALEAAERSE